MFGGWKQPFLAVASHFSILFRNPRMKCNDENVFDTNKANVSSVLKYNAEDPLISANE